ncbi:hypothetical protein B0H14DRAFT_2580941 [Mycena olivaceomarginata]|nr:hypothetical protein B0H14DRAFT_2580941 [Mycena olivaceomarginata]
MIFFRFTRVQEKQQGSKGSKAAGKFVVSYHSAPNTFILISSRFFISHAYPSQFVFRFSVFGGLFFAFGGRRRACTPLCLAAGIPRAPHASAFLSFAGTNALGTWHGTRNANVSGRESEEQEKGDANDTQRRESRAGRLDGKGRTTGTERAVDIKDRDKEKEHAQAQGKRSSGVWEAREGANGAREPVGGDAPRGEKSTDFGEGKTGRDSEVPVVYLPSAVGVIQPWAGSSILPRSFWAVTPPPIPLVHGPDIVKRTKPWAAFNPTPQGLLREVGTMYSILPAHRRSGEDSRPFLTLTPKKMNSEFD